MHSLVVAAGLEAVNSLTVPVSARGHKAFQCFREAAPGSWKSACTQVKAQDLGMVPIVSL